MFFLKKKFLVDFMLSCIFGYNLLSVMFLFIILEDKLFILMLALLKIMSVKQGGFIMLTVKHFFVTPVCGIYSLD